MKRFDTNEQAQAIRAKMDAKSKQLDQINALLADLVATPTMAELVAFIKTLKELLKKEATK